MNKQSISRNYRSITLDNSSADPSYFDSKNEGPFAFNNNNNNSTNDRPFFFNNNGNNHYACITNITSKSAFQSRPFQPQQLQHQHQLSNSQTLRASEELLTSTSLSKYMDLPIEEDLATLSFAGAFSAPSSNSNQTVDTIHATLGPRSLDTSIYPTSSALTSTPVQTSTPAIVAATTMTTGSFYGTGTFDTPYHATLPPSASLQDPRFFAGQQQQRSPPYLGFDSPPQTPMWESHEEAIVRALYHPSPLSSLANQQQYHIHFQQQQQSQQQHYNPPSLQYTHSHLHNLHQHHQQEMSISADVFLHALNDLSLSPPPPLMTSPCTEMEDSASSRGSISSSSDDEEDSKVKVEEGGEMEEGVKMEGGDDQSTPYSTGLLAHRKLATSNKKRHGLPKSKRTPVPKHPKASTHGASKGNKPQGKLHPCKECGRLFSRACNLQSHLTTHLGKKPFPCPDCKLAFARVYDMKRHHRIHSNVCPYQCAHCPKAFKRIEARERHILANHGRP